MNPYRRIALVLIVSGLHLATARADEAAIRKSVTLYASFDEHAKGDVGGGDLTLGTRFPHPTEKGKFVFDPEIDTAVIQVAKGKGVAGGALAILDLLPKNGWLYFPVKGNLAYKKDGWSGSASVWCNTDPNKLIKAKFCDPLQITQKGYDNGALWFDFNDAKPRDLRFGAFTTRPDGQKAIGEADPKAPLVRAPGLGQISPSASHKVIVVAGEYPVRVMARAAAGGPVVEAFTTLWIGPAGKRNDIRRPLPGITITVVEPKGR